MVLISHNKINIMLIITVRYFLACEDGNTYLIRVKPTEVQYARSTPGRSSACLIALGKGSSRIADYTMQY